MQRVKHSTLLSVSSFPFSSFKVSCLPNGNSTDPKKLKRNREWFLGEQKGYTMYQGLITKYRIMPERYSLYYSAKGQDLEYN